MKVRDEGTGEIRVERDPELARIELHLGDAAGENHRLLRLSREEARRLAALLLFEAGRLERAGAGSNWSTNAGRSSSGMSIRPGANRLWGGAGGTQ